MTDHLVTRTLAFNFTDFNSIDFYVFCRFFFVIIWTCVSIDDTKIFFSFHYDTRYDCLIQFSSDPVRLKYARNSFSLLVRVVDDLCLSDATDELLIALTHFTHTLLLRGDLSLAR